MPDQAPPQVRDFRPARDTVVPGFDGAFRVRFNEPIEPNRSLSRQMSASPAYRYRVSFGFSGFEVRPEGGWRPAVYHFVFPPPFTDLLNNRSSDTLVVTFSTGPPVTETRVAGRIRDRVTGRPVSGARATFLAVEGDSVPYAAVAGSEGTFRLPYVPPGAYAAYGFRDLNATLSLEPALEPYDSARFELTGPRDSVYMELLLVEPDTTPPRLLALRVRDSTSVTLAFDDPIAPDRGLEGADLGVEPVEEGGAVPVLELLLARDTAPEAAPADTAIAPGDTVAAAADSVPVAAADTAAAPDTLAAADTLAADTTAADSAAAAAARDTLALPDTLVVARLGRPLVAGRGYRVRARGFENLRRLSGGGDTTFVYEPPDTVSAGREAPDSAAVGDSVPAPEGAAARDSAARPDGVMVPDSAGAREPPRGGRPR